MERPSGSIPLQDLHRSPAVGTMEPAPGVDMDGRPGFDIVGGVTGVGRADVGRFSRFDSLAGADAGAARSRLAVDAPADAPTVVAGATGSAFRTDAISAVSLSKDGPASRLRNAVGESATRDCANCLNTDGSGFGAASSARSTSRI